MNFAARAKRVSLRALRYEFIRDVMVVVPRLPEWMTHGRGILKGFGTLKLPGDVSYLVVFLEVGLQSCKGAIFTSS